MQVTLPITGWHNPDWKLSQWQGWFHMEIWLVWFFFPFFVLLQWCSDVLLSGPLYTLFLRASKMLLLCTLYLLRGFPGGSDGKESTYKAGDLGSIPWSGRSPGKRNGCPLQYSCLDNPTDRGVWWATVHGSQWYLLIVILSKLKKL